MFDFNKRILSGFVTPFSSEIITKCLPISFNLTYFSSSEFFKEEYHRELDKMWKGALQKAGIIDGTAKEKKAPPKIHINDADRNCRDVFSCDVLIKLKVTLKHSRLI
jgi:hypothetical protein